MIWSEHAIDYEAGFDVDEYGCAHPRKIGCYVLTLEECDEILKKRFGEYYK